MISLLISSDLRESLLEGTKVLRQREDRAGDGQDSAREGVQPGETRHRLRGHG